MSSEAWAGLSLGLALGLRHALEADHLVAVTSMLGGGHSGRAAMGVGVWWGTGHATTLVVVGSLAIGGGWQLPPSYRTALDVVIGAVLVLLGLACVSRSGGAGMHWPRLRHDGPSPRRASGIGAIHGLAGGGPLVILLAMSFEAPTQQFLALAASALGSILGMMLVTAGLAVPFVWSARRARRWHRGLQLAAGAASVVYGLGFALRALPWP